MTTLRPYQQEAINSLFATWEQGGDHCLLVLPTGTGKSVVLSEIARTVHQWPGSKVLVVTHVQELVEQNFMELIRMWPQADAGINSAGLNRRDFKLGTIFCSIQSVFRVAHKFDRVDILIVDEAHLMPREAETMYGQFVNDLMVCNPMLKVVGLTATPFRLDSGRLDEGDKRLFTSIAYDYSIREAIEQGYLSPLVSKHTKTQLDTSGVGTRGGEFIAGELERAVDVETITNAAVDEVIAKAGKRKSWLFFCSGVSHAQHVCEAVRQRGFTCETIHAKTPKDERRRIITDFKAGRITALASMNVLTTGFNAPAVDLIALLRPTKSVGLYIQMAGRGTRLAPGKTDCLVLDFAGNIERHGPIDAIDIKKPKKQSDEPGEAPVKVCPDCEAYVHAAARHCEHCGHEFPPPQPKVQPKASNLNIMTSSAPEWQPVQDFYAVRHSKPGGTDSMRVTYEISRFNQVSEWICFEHTGFARQKAEQWWKRLGGQQPIPSTVSEALKRIDEVTPPAEILTRQEGKYTRVVTTRGALQQRMFA